MDEPSAVLGPGEMETLFKIISALRADGKTVLYISHRLDEIFAIADRVSVLRDGRLVGVYELDDQVGSNIPGRQDGGTAVDGAVP